MNDAHGGGHIEIVNGQLVARLGPLGRRFSGVDEVTHGSDVVVLRRGFVFARFAVTGDGKTAIISVPRWRWRQVECALNAAGISTTP